MNLNGSLAWRWQPDPSPPEPRAAVAWHAASRSLHARLEQLPENVQKRLYATASRDVLVVTGAAEDLPWAPGISYAATTAEAPTLWRPTLLRPDAPADLLSRALQQRHARQPLLLWPDPDAVIPLDRLLAITPRVLARIAEQWQAS